MFKLFFISLVILDGLFIMGSGFIGIKCEFVMGMLGEWCLRKFGLFGMFLKWDYVFMDGDLGGLMGILFMFGFLFIGCFEFELNKFFDNWLDWLIDLFKLFILFKR